MITLIHGDDTTKSRNFFYLERQKKENTIVLNGVSLSPADIIQNLQGKDLFNDKKFLFIEDFISKRKPSKETEEILTILNGHNNIDIFFWESKQLTTKQIGQFKNARSIVFKPPALLFEFLDAIKPGNGKQLITLFHQTRDQEEIQLIFTMFLRQIRLLLASRDQSHQESIDEIKRLAPWQLAKIKKQSMLFKEDELVQIHHRLFQIDMAQKTGTLDISLSASLDFLLITL